MDLKQFLETIVPPGVMVVARLVERTDADGNPYTTFAHRTSTFHAAAAKAIEEMAGSGENVYYAMAAYRQGFHTNAEGKKVLRVRPNVAAVKALWLDIDFKGAYPDAKTAVLALRAFSQATAVPGPSILVGSGNGLHAYWPLTEPVTVDRWQRLADALKAACLEIGLEADHKCTGDAARVLRPPGTFNYKDPANPKPVKILYTSGKLFDYEDLDAALTPYVKAAKAAPLTGVYAEFAGGVGTPAKPGNFSTLIRHCGVLRHVAETHGKDCTEPEWVATLQVLKHCEDGEQWVHHVSDGHPGYSEAGTDRKWIQRKANTAGPTLCSTFEETRKAICAKCPHNGFVKSPVQLGDDTTEALDGLPVGWRVAADKKGIERLMILDAGEGNTSKEWVKVLRHLVSNLRVTRSVVTNNYEVQFDIEMQGSKSWTLTLPGGHLGNSRKLIEALAEKGVVLKEKEGKFFLELMATWLSQLQAARRVADVTEQMGWLIDGDKLVGFSCGPSTFYADGRIRNDVRTAREFAPIAKWYEPRGGMDPWKKVATFLAEQDNPAFTAILAASFGAPLLKFTGVHGGILSIVSTASGVGKSSALKCSQAVWGSPTHGVNAVDDTPKSVARKLGFLNNLPAYWDELRGRQTIEQFLTLAFQITQGKEKSRLDSSATLRETATWETMLIVASNESIFEAMGRHAGGSDAGVVRTFEVQVEPIQLDRNRAEISLLFEGVNVNYGHAGRMYAQHLATHIKDVEERVQKVFMNLARVGNMQAQERFWFAIMASLIVGAELAGRLGLVAINVKTLTAFLMQNVNRLRGRTTVAMSSTEPSEILASFMAQFQDRALIVDKYPAPRANTATYVPDLTGGIPRSDKIAYHVARDEKRVRIPLAEFTRWLEHRELPVYQTVKRMRAELKCEERRARLGIGTKWELPPQKLLEFDLSQLPAAEDVVEQVLRSDGSSNPADSPGSLPEAAPAS